MLCCWQFLEGDTGDATLVTSVIILANLLGSIAGLEALLEATIVFHSCTEIKSHRVK